MKDYKKTNLLISSIIKKQLLNNELKLINKLNTPLKIKKFIDSLNYNENSWITIKEVLKKRKAACLEAAILASILLNYHKYESYLLDLEAIRDEDHVIAIYKQNEKWGAIAKSKFINLKHREPIYNSYRELALSYFEHYFNYYGELSLRRYSKPFSIIKIIKKHDLNSLKLIENTAQSLVDIKHFLIFKDKKIKLSKVSPEKFWSEIQILPANSKVGKKYMLFKQKINKQ